MKDLLLFIVILMTVRGVFGFAISGPTGLLPGIIVFLLLFIIFQLHKLMEINTGQAALLLSEQKSCSPLLFLQPQLMKDRPSKTTDTDPL